MIGEIRAAGPCAAESKEQMIKVATALKKVGIEIVRASWWKPRTSPGWDGVGKRAAPWAAEITNMGMIVATEVLQPDHVIKIIKGIEENNGNPEKVLLWLGSRNQNDRIQKSIARTILNQAPDKVKLLVKNQPWADSKHWVGIVRHLESVGFPLDRILLCHRGFNPYKIDNPRLLRNVPDWEIVEQVKKQTGLPMIIDPSHIGGTVDNVINITMEASKTGLFDGFLIESHPQPEIAKTDAKQQLTINQLADLLKKI